MNAGAVVTIAPPDGFRAMAEEATVKPKAGEATHAEVGQAAPEHAPGFPPFASETFASQLFWFALLFGGLYILMSRVGLPRVGAIIADRGARIARDLDDANAMQKQAEAAGVLHDKTIADAKATAQATAQAQRDKAAAETEARRAEVEKGLVGKLAAAEASIADMKNRAMANVDSIAHEAAAGILQHLTGRPASAEAVTRALAAIKQA